VFESGQEEMDENPATNTPLKGLCSNCLKSHYCHLPKKQSGVWHCGEYEWDNQSGVKCLKDY
jgi:hypothetical protein